MSNLTRRAILRGSTVAAAAAAFGVPAVALAETTVTQVSTDPLVALAARSAALRSAERMAYLRWYLFELRNDPVEFGQFIDRLGPNWPDEQRAALVKMTAEYDEKAEDEEEVTRSSEISRIQDEMARAPARTLDGLLAKLRWIADYSDDVMPELPTLKTAYDWQAVRDIDGVAVSAWADAERLIGEAGKGGAA